MNAQVFPAVLAVSHTKVRIRSTLLSPPASLFLADSKVSGERPETKEKSKTHLALIPKQQRRVSRLTPIFRFVVRNINKTTRSAPDREGFLLRGEEVVVRLAGAREGEEFAGVEVGEDLFAQRECQRRQKDKGGRKEEEKRTSTSKSIGMVFNTSLLCPFPFPCFFSLPLPVVLPFFCFFFAGILLPHSKSLPSLSSLETAADRPESQCWTRRRVRRSYWTYPCPSHGFPDPSCCHPSRSRSSRSTGRRQEGRRSLDRW
jgi:hypothetical protein